MTDTLQNTDLSNSDLPLVTGVQMNSQQDIEQNFATATKAVAESKDQGSTLVVLPENVCSMGRQQQTAQRFDELSARFAQLASDYQLYLLAGTLPCPYRPNGDKVADNKLRQVSLLFAPDGSQIARYDKIHLFKALVNDTHGNYDESLTFEAGTELVTASVKLASSDYKLGMMVCFDLRFPKLAQSLRQIGANILTAPSAFTYQTGKANWSLLLQARALDSQCLLIGAAQGGEHVYNHGHNDDKNQTSQLQPSHSRKTWGHASIAEANGQIVAQCNSDMPEVAKGYQLVTSVFNPSLQQQIRKNLPIFNCHRLV